VTQTVAVLTFRKLAGILAVFTEAFYDSPLSFKQMLKYSFKSQDIYKKQDVHHEDFFAGILSWVCHLAGTFHC
jgi:hypothetical protein